MRYQTRKFRIERAMRKDCHPIIGIAGETKTGKTFSALELATGISSVVGGRITLVDTEGYAREYAEFFDFDVLDLAPPYGPLDYMAAIDQAILQGGRVIIVDQMSHEHSGRGGVMDQIEQWLDEQCGDDEHARQAQTQRAHAKIKPQRRKLNDFIKETARSGIFYILCYRAEEKVRPETGKGIIQRGFVPETTSNLRYDMRISFLLMPGSKGVPRLSPERPEEILWAELREPFAGWIKEEQLSRRVGEKIARWATNGHIQELTSYQSPFAGRDFRTALSGEGMKADYSKDSAPLCPKCGGQTRFVKAGRKGNVRWQAGWACNATPQSCKQRGVKGAWVDAAAWHEQTSPPPQQIDTGGGDTKIAGTLLVAKLISLAECQELGKLAASLGWKRPEYEAMLKRQGWDGPDFIPASELERVKGLLGTGQAGV